MKVFKNKKQRFVAVFLSLVFAFMLVPFTDAYASAPHFAVQGSKYVIDHYDENGELDLDLEYTFSSCDSDIIFVSKCYSNSDGTITRTNNVVAASLSPFSVKFESSTNRRNDNESLYENGLYVYNMTSSYAYGGNYPTDHAGLFSAPPIPSYYIFSFDDIKRLLGGDDSGFEYSDPEGGINKPIYDEEIGTLIISKSKMYEESNGEDVNDLYNLFSWKMKTNTGFSLSDNKYARTFIQVRVESKCVVYADRRHTKFYKKFDNYGEKAMLINSYPVDSQPLKISYLSDIPNVLPKTHAETHNPVYAGYNYTLYFRVVCTDDLAVIPSDTSEWHCGGWRALDCNADILVGQSDTTENGSFDDNDNWVPDEDDGNNHIESGSDSVHDSDDAKDDFNNSSSEVDSSVNGAISTMQSLLDMIRHVPQIISIIFSFLPSWCLNIVGLAFVALVVLIIYKLVRG